MNLRTHRWLPLRILSWVLILSAARTIPCLAQTPAEVVRQAQTKVVKVYGTGGFRSLEGYQSGFFVSQDGLVATAWSYVLDPESIRIVDHFGETSQATLVGFDPETEVALLQTDLRPAQWFPLDQLRRRNSGTSVYAISNLFNVAAGDEPVSVQAGIISAFTRLPTSANSPTVLSNQTVYLIDAISNNPGSNGGALVDRQGQLVGMLGRELRSPAGQFWLNYALPADLVAQGVQRIQNPLVARPDNSSAKDPLQAMDPSALGLTLTPRLTLNTPPYIEWVETDSVAWKAGLRPDDLILKIQGQLITNTDQAQSIFQQQDRFAAVQMTIRRGDQLLTLTLTP